MIIVNAYLKPIYCDEKVCHRSTTYNIYDEKFHTTNIDLSSNVKATHV